MALPAPAATASDNSNQALLILLERLGRNQERLGELDPALGRMVQSLVDAPVNTRQDDLYRTRLAYAVQDAERLIGPVVPDGALRREIDERANTFPGLNNGRVQALVQQTGVLEDREAIKEIRRLASDTAKLGSNQEHPEIAQRAGAIESLLQAARASVTAPPANPRQTQEGPADAATGPATPTSSEPGGFRQRASPADAAEPSHRQQTQTNLAGGEGPATTGSTPAGSAPVGANQAQRGATVADALVQGAGRLLNAVNNIDNRTTAGTGGTIASLLHAMTNREPLRQAGEAEGHTPMRGQFANFREHAQTRKDDAQLQATERAGAAAIADMKAFASGPASTIMQRIRDASASDPNGMAGVLDGMRPGGRYQDFGEQLQRERTISPAFAAAQDKATASLAAYGTAREAAAAIGQRRGEDAVSGRLDRLDAQIGNEASALPGKTPGQNMLQELAERVRELIQRAIERITAAFTARPSAGAGPSPTP